jgi:TfoX/Sxy family transcriptional regulator of competence genes
MEVLAGWSDDIARALRETGPDVTERSIFGGSAFFVGDSFVGLVENVSGQLRVRFREELRGDLSSRSHYDPTAALPTLLIITADDRDHARSLAPKAYERAKRPAPAAPARAAAAPVVTVAAGAATKGAEPATRRRRQSR